MKTRNRRWKAFSTAIVVLMGTFCGAIQAAADTGDIASLTTAVTQQEENSGTDIKENTKREETTTPNNDLMPEEKPEGEGTQIPDTEKPEGEGTQTPDAEKPEGEGTQTPDAEKPEGEGTQTPDAEKPEGEGTQTPDTEKPEGEGTQTPDAEKPEGEGTQTPDTEIPKEENSQAPTVENLENKKAPQPVKVFLKLEEGNYLTLPEIQIDGLDPFNANQKIAYYEDTTQEYLGKIKNQWYGKSDINRNSIENTFTSNQKNLVDAIKATVQLTDNGVYCVEKAGKRYAVLFDQVDWNKLIMVDPQTGWHLDGEGAVIDITNLGTQDVELVVYLNEENDVNPGDYPTSFATAKYTKGLGTLKLNHFPKAVKNGICFHEGGIEYSSKNIWANPNGQQVEDMNIYGNNEPLKNGIAKVMEKYRRDNCYVLEDKNGKKYKIKVEDIDWYNLTMSDGNWHLDGIARELQPLREEVQCFVYLNVDGTLQENNYPDEHFPNKYTSSVFSIAVDGIIPCDTKNFNLCYHEGGSKYDTKKTKSDWKDPKAADAIETTFTSNGTKLQEILNQQLEMKKDPTGNYYLLRTKDNNEYKVPCTKGIDWYDLTMTNDGWHLNGVAYEVGEIIDLYTVTYTDGVENETVFEDELHTDLKAGDFTPRYNNGKNPTRKGYIFKGWEPKVSEKVTGNATYVAQWEKENTVDTIPNPNPNPTPDPTPDSRPTPTPESDKSSYVPEKQPQKSSRETSRKPVEIVETPSVERAEKKNPETGSANHVAAAAMLAAASLCGMAVLRKKH